MNKELEDKLFNNYPILYKDKSAPETESLLCYGFMCGDGWYDILDRLSSELEELNTSNINYINNPIYALEIKVKFGELRFYIKDHTNEPDIDKYISKYTQEANNTCELCGSKANVNIYNKKGWLVIRCRDCFNKLTNIIKNEN